MTRLNRIVIAAALALAAVGATGQGAHAAYPTTSYYVSYGNSVLKGKLTWYNRSVGISGSLSVASGCKYAFYWGWAGNYDTGGRAPVFDVCGGSLPFTSKMDGFPAGGASRVRVRLMDTNLGSVGSDICTRNGCSTE
jgi:hypothetical protein